MAELYRMANGFDIGAIIKVILGKILRSVILLILYIDSKSFYDCIVKLGTIYEK